MPIKASEALYFETTLYEKLCIFMKEVPLAPRFTNKGWTTITSKSASVELDNILRRCLPTVSLQNKYKVAQKHNKANSPAARFCQSTCWCLAGPSICRWLLVPCSYYLAPTTLCFLLELWTVYISAPVFPSGVLIGSVASGLFSLLQLFGHFNFLFPCPSST